MPRVTLSLLGGLYGVARLGPEAPIPGWADGPGFVSISRAAAELSVTCLAERIPLDVRAERGWRCLAMPGPFAFDETGVLLSVVRPLTEAGLGLFVVSTFDGDHLLAKEAELGTALDALRAAGHEVHAPT